MQHLAIDIPEQEWRRILIAARQAWPDRRSSDAELMRRCMVLGVRTLSYLSPEAAKQFVTIYRDYTPPFDGHDALRPTTPDAAEGDHLGK